MSGVTRFFSGPIYLLFLVNGGNVVNNLPFHDDLGLQKHGARFEPAELGVPFADHSAINTANK